MSFEEIDLQWFANAEDEGRTEDPTDQKIRKAREEGRVAKSQEINGAIVLICTLITLFLMGSWILKKLQQVFIYYFTRVTVDKIDNGAFAVTFAMFFLQIVLPVLVVSLVAGVIANIVQNKGFLFTLKPITPQFSKILPRIGQYLKKTVFSLEGGFNVLKSLMKVAAISIVAYIFIRPDLEENAAKLLHSGSLIKSIGFISSKSAFILIFSAVIFLAIAIPDYFVQKKQFMETLKMTKQEVKQEYKDMEGDPEVKGKLDQAQRELLSRNIPHAVKESDVVIANPTHFAVALKYDSTVTYAPKIMARGADNLAFAIRKAAKENDIPIVENKALARSLYTETKVGDIIPEDYMEIIATIYAKVVYMNKRM
ncbi:MAG: flagellar biosynthesis protein FlhB [Treponema sp.]|nr:flagellar biosynthesis protein FlhB [Treponema sp.]